MRILFRIDQIRCSELKLGHRQYRMQDKMEGRTIPARISGIRTRASLPSLTLHGVGE